MSTLVVVKKQTYFSDRLLEKFRFESAPVRIVEIENSPEVVKEDSLILLWDAFEPEVFDPWFKKCPSLTVVLFEAKLPDEIKGTYTLINLCSRDPIWKKVCAVYNLMNTGIITDFPRVMTVPPTRSWTFDELYTKLCTHLTPEYLQAFGIQYHDAYRFIRATNSSEMIRVRAMEKLVPVEHFEISRGTIGPFCITGFDIHSKVINQLEDFEERGLGRGWLFQDALSACYESIYHALEHARVLWPQKTVSLFVASTESLATPLMKKFGFKGMGLDVNMGDASGALAFYFAHAGLMRRDCEVAIVCGLSMDPVPCVVSLVLQSAYHNVHTLAQIRGCVSRTNDQFAFENMTTRVLEHAEMHATEVQMIMLHGHPMEEKVSQVLPKVQKTVTTKHHMGDTGPVSALCSIVHALHLFKDYENALVNSVGDCATHVQIMLEKMCEISGRLDADHTALILAADTKHEMCVLAGRYANAMNEENWQKMCLSSCITRIRKRYTLGVTLDTMEDYKRKLRQVERGLVVGWIKGKKRPRGWLGICFNGAQELDFPLFHHFDQVGGTSEHHAEYALWRMFDRFGVRFDVFMGESKHEEMAAVACGRIPFNRIGSTNEPHHVFSPYLSTKTGEFLDVKEFGSQYWKFEANRKKEAIDAFWTFGRFLVQTSKIRHMSAFIKVLLELDLQCDLQINWPKLFNGVQCCELPRYPFPPHTDKISLIGCGGHFRTVMTALSFDEVEGVYAETGIGQIVGRFQVKPLSALPRNGRYHVCVGDAWARRRLMAHVGKLGELVTIQHPTAEVKHSVIGKGCFIGPQTLLEHCKIGRGTIVQAGAKIHHDVRVGEYGMIASNCVVLGRAQLGDFVFLGALAAVAPGRKVASHTKVYMGVTVKHDVEEEHSVLRH